MVVPLGCHVVVTLPAPSAEIPQSLNLQLPVTSVSISSPAVQLLAWEIMDIVGPHASGDMEWPGEDGGYVDIQRVVFRPSNSLVTFPWWQVAVVA